MIDRAQDSRRRRDERQLADTLGAEGPQRLGAKGVGEPALIPTAPAILGAIDHATGVRLTRIPALPHRVLAALKDRTGP